MRRTRTPPDLLIVGAHKAGTTSLHSFLDSHPQIEMSSPKEPHYLVRQSCQVRLHTGVFDPDDYYSLWNRPSGELLTGESSVLYLPFAKEVIDNIEREFLKAPRIIICLRDPILRARSAFLDESLKDPNETATSFQAAIDREFERGARRTDGDASPTLRYLALSHYADGVRAFQQAFGVEQVNIIESSELLVDPETVMKRLQNFLTVTHDDSWKILKSQNVGQIQWSSRSIARAMRARSAVRTRRFIKSSFPGLHSKVRDASLSRLTGPASEFDAAVYSNLRDLFRDDVAEVQRLITRDLSHWMSD